MYFDLPLHELERYSPDETAPADFDAFWAATLAASRAFALSARFEPVDSALRQIEVYDVTYAGFGGAPIRGWLLLPAPTPGPAAPLPCVVEYLGYGGGRGHPTDWLLYASLGYAHLVMDTRGQGGAWRPGDTPDPQAGGEPHLPGFMTQGILSRDTYYYRRLYVDAVRAVEAARAHPRVDPARVAVAGGSQGGGLALAAAALAGDVQLCLADVPFLCHFTRAVTLTDDAPFGEIARYLRVQRTHTAAVMTTLSYFDGLHLAARAGARALFSVGLMDRVCPPSTVYAAYNRYAGPKELCVYPFNGHEGGEGAHTQEKIRTLRTWLPPG